MPHHSRFFYFLTLFFMLSCLAASVASACLCARGSFKTRWQGAEVIFQGKVKEIKIDHPRYLNVYDDKPVEITFEVSGYFKGGNGKMTEFPLDRPVPLTASNQEMLATGRRIVPEADKDKTFLMHTSLQHVTCMGYPFTEGEEYLVFAYLREEGSGNRWSLYHYPAGTYGVGGACGGTALYNTPEAQEDMDRIQIFLSRSKGRGGGLLKFPLNN